VRLCHGTKRMTRRKRTRAQGTRGVKEYIEKVILNPNLEKELEITGGKYKIPTTPKPGPEEKSKDEKDPNKESDK
jgi:hypothetical protein